MPRSDRVTNPDSEGLDQWLPIVVRLCCAFVAWGVRIVCGMLSLVVWLPIIDIGVLIVQLWANQPLRERYKDAFGSVASLTVVPFSGLIIAIWLLISDIYRLVKTIW